MLQYVAVCCSGVLQSIHPGIPLNSRLIADLRETLPMPYRFREIKRQSVLVCVYVCVCVSVRMKDSLCTSVCL